MFTVVGPIWLLTMFDIIVIHSILSTVYNMMTTYKNDNNLIQCLWWVKEYSRLFENITFTKITFAQIPTSFKVLILFTRTFIYGLFMM